jgi:hypothetical protein
MGTFIHSCFPDCPILKTMHLGSCFRRIAVMEGYKVLLTVDTSQLPDVGTSSTDCSDASAYVNIYDGIHTNSTNLLGT